MPVFERFPGVSIGSGKRIQDNEPQDTFVDFPTDTAPTHPAACRSTHTLSSYRLCAANGRSFSGSICIRLIPVIHDKLKACVAFEFVHLYAVDRIYDFRKRRVA